MTRTQSTESIVGLVREFLKQPRESESIEFKQNNDDAQAIGEYISALANSAALEEKAFAYLLWGVDDATRRVVGTTFDPGAARRGNEELESWILRLLSPRVDFRFFEAPLPEGRVVVLEIARAFPHPVKFSGEEYIRVGSYKKKLKEFPEKERALWRLLDTTPFEKGVAAERVSDEEVLRLLDVPAYFELLKLPLPDGRAAMLAAFAAEGLVTRADAGGWDVTHLGAVLFARDLGAFPSLRRKTLRVVLYRGEGKTETDKEREVSRGYAVAFTEAVALVMALVPSHERLTDGRQREESPLPEVAVRELIANALIHQDFSATGAGPMVELFANRLEVTNPGEPLVETNSFVDTPPKSRNEALASLMRRFDFCEERGSGIDKVVRATEQHRLPPPLFEVPPGFTRAVLFGPRTFAEMSRQERLRACYLHACLKYAERDYLTNPSIRERFGIEEGNRAAASRLIRDATEAGLIVADDPGAAPRWMRYVPYWAKLGRGVGPS